MKYWVAVAALIIGMLAGYVLGNVVPFSGFSFAPKDPASGTKLEVKLVTGTGSPLSNIEVDVAEKAGPPPEGGAAFTDERGIATFRLKPGSYVIYFNLRTYPKNLDWPQEGPETPVQVIEGTVNQKTLILRNK